MTEGYDALNRVTGKAYSAQSCPLSSPVVSYMYDSGANTIGHLTSLTDQAGSASYSYDVLERMAAETRTIAGITKNMSYTYNLDSSLKTLTNPSGAVITYTPDSAGRDVSAIDSGNGISYVTAASYGPDSSLTGFVSGSSGSFAGITNKFSYNPRLQPINMAALSPTATVFSLNYNFNLGAGDNGNVLGITNNKDTTRNQSFSYDTLNRLTSAQNAGTNCAAATVNGKSEYWANGYGYDAWGNLLQKTVTKCSAENLSVTALANNQLSGYTYDAAGNMTFDPTDSVTASYDQENRILTASKSGVTTTYTYDSDGNRVEKSNSSTATLYWYMTPGIVAESGLSGNLTSEYVFFDGERVARKDFPGLAVSYYFSDHLKTTDIVTDAAGNIKNESDFYPWGGELQFTNNDSNHYKFTGKERDAETGLDYFGARYYSNGLGRFITPDWSAGPVPVPYADLDDPQSLNQYSYVRNLPTTRRDPDGHFDDPFGTFDTYTVSDSHRKTTNLNGPDGPAENQQNRVFPVVVGQRRIHNKWAQFFSVLFTLHFAYHSYYRVTGDDGVTHQFEVLGDPGSRRNQQVRDTYGTERQSVSAGSEHTVYVTDAQAQALIKGSEYFLSHPCPTCTGGQEGYNLVFHNSNSFVYNMLNGDPAGRIPPPAAPFITPGYVRKPDNWYPEP
jgi:RHS repeat-associated protein